MPARGQIERRAGNGPAVGTGEVEIVAVLHQVEGMVGVHMRDDHRLHRFRRDVLL
jgi:hypothetical protein